MSLMNGNLRAGTNLAFLILALDLIQIESNYPPTQLKDCLSEAEVAQRQPVCFCVKKPLIHTVSLGSARPSID